MLKHRIWENKLVIKSKTTPNQGRVKTLNQVNHLKSDLFKDLPSVDFYIKFLASASRPMVSGTKQ